MARGDGGQHDKSGTRPRLFVPGPEGPQPGPVGAPGWPSGPERSAGGMRSSSPVCLEREVAVHQSSGGEIRVRATRFPARETLEDFDFDNQRPLKRDVLAHLGTLDFVTAKDNVVVLGPPRDGQDARGYRPGIRACQAGHRVAFAIAAEWVDQLALAQWRRAPCTKSCAASGATR